MASEWPASVPDAGDRDGLPRARRQRSGPPCGCRKLRTWQGFRGVPSGCLGPAGPPRASARTVPALPGAVAPGRERCALAEHPGSQRALPAGPGPSQGAAPGPPLLPGLRSRWKRALPVGRVDPGRRELGVRREAGDVPSGRQEDRSFGRLVGARFVLPAAGARGVLGVRLRRRGLRRYSLPRLCPFNSLRKIFCSSE